MTSRSSSSAATSVASTLRSIPIRVESPVRGRLLEVASPQRIYARSVGGRYARLRWLFVWMTQLFFYGAPWLTWNGRQAVLFDLQARAFYVFGLVMWPQDLIFLAALLTVSALGLFLFTAVGGRQWCGYACPQTVYTEIFMWIERRTEGDRQARMKRDAGPLTAERVWRRTAKQLAWAGVAGWTGVTFVGYFTPIGPLVARLAALGAGPWESFWTGFYGLATWANAGYLREQVCKHMCPYARFQGAMFDAETLIISYDARRGEPRGSRSRGTDPRSVGLGGCVDCTLCVQVCPTGIDIRNGLQYECISCGACIDACDGVMAKLGDAPGLIRYSTQRADAGGAIGSWRERLSRPRTLVYGGLLLATCTAIGVGLQTRAPIRVDVIREGRMLAQVDDEGVTNRYRLHLMNASERPARYRVGLEGVPGLRLAQQTLVTLPSADSVSVAVQAVLPAHEASVPGSRQFSFRIVDVEQGAAVTVPAVFVVPR